MVLLLDNFHTSESIFISTYWLLLFPHVKLIRLTWLDGIFQP